MFFFNMCKRKDDLVMSLENSARQTFLGFESLELRASNLQFMKMTTTRLEPFILKSISEDMLGTHGYAYHPGRKKLDSLDLLNGILLLVETLS